MRQTRADKCRKRHRKILVSILAVILLLFALAAGGLWMLLHASFDMRSQVEQESAMEEYMVAPIDKVNIMVVGVDRRTEDIGRSDTLFIMTADPEENQISMLSIPRDTRVLIPGYGYDKINHAYSLGGHQLTEKSVERLLNMPIDHYVLIDFKSFFKIIDALGGIDIYVDERMYYEDPWDDNGGLVIDIQPGMQHMDGEMAIQYVRYRDEDGDIGRVERQQKFLKAVMDRVASPTILTKIPALIYQISASVETDLSMSQMFSLAAMFKQSKDNGMRAYMVPGEPVYIDEISYWMPNVEVLRENMANQMGVFLDAKHKAKNREEADAYSTSLPDGVTQGAYDFGRADGASVRMERTRSADASHPIRMRVIDATGVGASPAKIEAMLEGKNIRIVSMASSPVVSDNTLVITSTASEHVINEVNNLPFAYTLRIEQDNEAAVEAVWIVGKDFL